ncbi:MAG: hypothetical protein K0U86_12990 [Planctomycetes bacterium]|nr:hypothetical protein [Planctomycetota bacterium]MCH9725805.1 hypothetical protein [Planctomycetota bacterium]MCH9792386.1 hypothetical protein [Planctomycetota bacterium]
MGTDRPFDAETRIDLHMQANNEWDIDLADIFFRLGMYFGIECPDDEWFQGLGIDKPVTSIEEWERDIAPGFTFGALARFIQDRAVANFSFQPVTMINRECATAGAFYGIQQVSEELTVSKHPSCQFGPSTKIIDVFRGNALQEFWSQLSWKSEHRIPELPASWRNMGISGIAEYYFYLGCFCYLIAGGVAFYTSNIIFIVLTAVVMFCVQYLIHIDNVKRKYSTNPLPPEIQTFRDLAIVIANSECDEFQKT